MSTRTSRFLSRTVGDATSQLTRRTPVALPDEEHGPSTSLFKWFSLNRPPNFSRTVSTADDEKAPQDKAKKLGTFSGVDPPHNSRSPGSIPTHPRFTGVRANNFKCSFNPHVPPLRIYPGPEWHSGNAGCCPYSLFGSVTN